jgi:ATP-dependent DNA helicase RecG
MQYRGFVFGQIGHFFNTFFKDYLPFELTNAQKRVLREIRTDVGTGKQMNRLLLGGRDKAGAIHRRVFHCI